jgi:hypothetical protein
MPQKKPNATKIVFTKLSVNEIWKQNGEIRKELDQTQRMQLTGTFSDQTFRSYSSLKMTCLKKKCKNRSVFCDLEFAMFDISTSTEVARPQGGQPMACLL